MGYLQKKKIYAFDFDGTLCKEAFPGIGRPNKAVIRLAKRVKRKGNPIILWTWKKPFTGVQNRDWNLMPSIKIFRKYWNCLVQIPGRLLPITILMTKPSASVLSLFFRTNQWL